MAGERAALCYVAFPLVACSEPIEGSYFSPSASAGAGAQAVVGVASSGSSGLAPAAPAQAAAGSGAEVGGSLGEPLSDAGFCTGQAVGVADLASGNVRGGATVLLPKLVVSSQKFLLSASKTSGKCLWGAFAADEGASGENSGVLLLSSVDGTTSAAGGGASVVCPSDLDSLPSDLAPGDRVSAFGDFSEYAPSACHDVAPMRELLVKPGCSVLRTGRGAPPATVAISFELADQLAQGKDKALLRAWSGARIELDGLDALAASSSASAVGAFGVIRVQQTKLELHSKIPYADLSAGGPDQPTKALDYEFPVHFERAAGVLFLDYCTWSLDVCEPCLDLAPQSRGCSTSGG